jgi:hypothetical protein
MEENIMSLVTSEMEPFVMLDKKSVADGFGGFIREWTEGAQFSASAVLDSSTTARIGAMQGLTSLYTITTNKNVNLQYHEVFMRLSDRKVFRATSDGDDKATPAMASLDMRQVSAEEFTLTTD